MKHFGKVRQVLFAGLGFVMLAACGGGTPTAVDGRVKVLATTSIVGDVVARVGGDGISLTLLLPVGTDPHGFSPRPQDAAALAEADIIFANGAGLEGFLPALLESAGAANKVVEVSAGIELLPLPGGDKPAGDPHTWMDPNNVLIWTQNITTALSSADPAHASDYEANAATYAASLQDLDAWIRSEVTQVPAANRVLVSDHAVLGYFATRYGFTQAGTITGSFSSEAAPSARELAALEDKIRSDGVKAIFVTEASNQALAGQVAKDTGIQTIWLYHASLTEVTGPAPTYLEFMRYNVTAIVKALK
jgi:ABC-type Zn uptake system ZnuABC Zn-binding protein ZnuA